MIWPTGKINMFKIALPVQCTSRRGIVAAISAYLAEQGCNITDSAQFDDTETGNFFMRVSFKSEEGRTVALNWPALLRFISDLASVGLSRRKRLSHYRSRIKASRPNSLTWAAQAENNSTA